MEAYQAILDNIQLQMGQQSADQQKIYRYSGLIHAIEFFSQRFSLEEIIRHIYDFTNELLICDSIAVMICDEQNPDTLIPSLTKGYDETPSLKGHDMDHIVYFHAGLLETETLDQYFDQDTLAYYNPDLTLQLIMDKKLLGLVFVGSIDSNFDVEDRLIANALMNLFSTSLTNHITYQQLELTKQSLDEKVFNLFAINHATKTLLGEMNISSLIALSLSVYSELTQSRLTGLFLYDISSENYLLHDMLDVFKPDNNVEITLYPHDGMAYTMHRSVFDMTVPEDCRVFHSLFQNDEDVLAPLSPTHIITIHNSYELLGFITLSDKVNDTPYKSSEFELIESLAASTFIALSNANHLNEVLYQRQLIDDKLSKLHQLNTLMKNINTALDVPSLLDLVRQTLQVSFGFTEGFIALYKSDDLSYTCHALSTNEVVGHFSDTLSLGDLHQGETLCFYTLEQVKQLENTLQTTLTKDDANGLMLVPMSIDIEGQPTLGILGISGVQNGLIFDEANKAILESIAHHVAPVLHQLQKTASIVQQYLPDYRYLFKEALNEQLDECREFYLDLYVLHIQSKSCFMSEPIQLTLDMDDLHSSGHHYFPIDGQNTLFLFNNEVTIREIASRNPHLKSTVYSLDTDFSDYKSLMTCLS